MNKLDKNDEKARELFFESVVKPSNPKIEVGKWLSANDLGIGGNYENSDQKSFVCASWGVTSQKSHGPKTMFWDEIIPNINFMEWKKGKNMTTTPAKRGRGRPKGTKKADPVGVEITKEEAQNHLEAFIQRQKEGVICYPYYDIDGNLIQIKTRSLNKKFYLYCWDGKKWIAKAYKRNAKCPLFGLQQLKDIDENAYIFLCEGEKAAKAVQEAGQIALGVPGATRAHDTDLDILEGEKVIIWADNDDAGRHMAEDVAKILEVSVSDISLVNEKNLVHCLKGAFENDIVPEGFDAADLKVEDRKKVVEFCIDRYKENQAQLEEEEKSKYQAIHNYLSCFVETTKGEVLIPIDYNKAAQVGREKYDGEFITTTFSQIKTEISKIDTLDGFDISMPDGGSDPFREVKNPETKMKEPSPMFAIYREINRKNSYKPATEVAYVKRIKQESCFQLNKKSLRTTLYPEYQDFLGIEKEDYKEAKDIKETEVYKNLIAPVLGDNQGSMVFINWLARIIATYVEGDKNIMNRLPILALLGDPGKGKSAILSVINAIFCGKGVGNLNKYAMDPLGFPSVQLNYPILAGEDLMGKNMWQLVAAACKAIQTNSAMTIERKGKDSVEVDIRRAAMIQSNVDPESIKVLRNFCKKDMLKRSLFIFAHGEGVEEFHGGAEEAGDYISGLQNNIPAILEFVSSLYKCYKENAKEDIYIKNFMDEECKSYLEEVSVEFEVEKFIKWLKNEFQPASKHYQACVSLSSNGRFLFRSNVRNRNEIRITLPDLREIYKYYREKLFEGETNAVVKRLLSDDEIISSYSPFASMSNLKAIIDEVEGVEKDRVKINGKPQTCIIFEEPEFKEPIPDLELEPEPEIEIEVEPTLPLGNSFKQPHPPKDDARSYIDSVNENPKPKPILKEMKEQPKEIPENWNWAIPK